MTSTKFGNEEFEDEDKKIIQKLLGQKLPGQHIAIRPGAGSLKVAYVESWKAIELANTIFGFDGWSSTIVDITPDFIEETKGGKYRVGVSALVKVMLKDGTFHEDVGYGSCENQSKGMAIENAKKEAVSDARKRCLRVFGNALGNCIYDKEHMKKVKPQIGTHASGSVTYDQARAQGNLDIFAGMELEDQKQQLSISGASHGFVGSDADAGFVFQDANETSANNLSGSLGQFSPTKRKLGTMMNGGFGHQQFQHQNGAKQDSDGNGMPALIKPSLSPLKLPTLLSAQPASATGASLPNANANTNALSGTTINNGLASSVAGGNLNADIVSGGDVVDAGNTVTRPQALLPLPKLQQPASTLQPLQSNSTIQARFASRPDDQKMDIEPSKPETKLSPLLTPNVTSAPMTLPTAPNATLNVNNAGNPAPTMTINPHVPPRKIVTALRQPPPNGMPLVVNKIAGTT